MTQTPAADWDASRYHRVAQPHAAWGANVLDRLRLRGDETVLDAGCGSGKVTAQLLERLPRGRVIGADLSESMLREAAEMLREFEGRVSFVQTDLLQLDTVVSQNVDAVFSTATFHWINDHPRLFRAVRGVMKPGAQLVSQFGGGRNLAEFMQATDDVSAREPYREHVSGKRLWRYFAWPDETAARLREAGFADVETWLEPSPQTFPTLSAFVEFAKTVVLRNHVNALPVALREDFQAEVAEAVFERMGNAYVLDYVRLNADARAQNVR